MTIGVLLRGRFGRGWVLVLAIVAAGCGLQTTPTAPLSYSNQTSIPIDIVVNGTKLVTIAPGRDGTLPVSQLPALPWNITAQTAGGRVLASVTVRPGDVVVSGAGERGAGVRADLSCGRVDIWSGPPLGGPPPGTGTPGDCDG